MPKMFCEAAQSRMYEYLEGELSEEERRELEEHMSGCEQCRSVFAEYRRTLEMIGGLKPDVPDFVAPAMEKIRQERAGRERKPIMRRRVAAYIASVAAVLLFGFTLIYNQTMRGGQMQSASAPQFAEGSYSQRDENASIADSAGKGGMLIYNGQTAVLTTTAEHATELQNALTSEVKSAKISPTEDGYTIILNGAQEQVQTILDRYGIPSALEKIEEITVKIE